MHSRDTIPEDFCDEEQKKKSVCEEHKVYSFEKHKHRDDCRLAMKHSVLSNERQYQNDEWRKWGNKDNMNDSGITDW